MGAVGAVAGWGIEYRLPDHMFLDAVPTKATCVLSHISGHFFGPLSCTPPSPKPQTLQPQRGDPETR